MIRTVPLLLALAQALAACASPPTGGGGIVSTNPCADAMLVRLVPHDRIAAISRYSQDAAATSMPIGLAKTFRATAGTAEEVIALAPDLVVASSFTPPATRDAFVRAGLKTLYLDSPQTIAASQAQVMELATAVGASVRGQAMAAEIAASLPERRADVQAPAALLYIFGDLATGGGTLLDEMLTRSGFRNAAAGYGLRFTGRLSAESIVAHPPDIVIAPPGGRARQTRRALLPATREAVFANDLISCGGPTIPAAMARLAAIRATL